MTAPIEKIRRLLRLAASSNVHEAAAAAAKAQELLSRWGLREQDVAEQTDEPVVMPIKCPRSIWRRWLLIALSEVNAARCLQKSGGIGYLILARREVGEAVAYLFAYLTRTIDRLCLEAVTQVQPADHRAWMRSFRLGAARTVGERLRAAHEAACMDAVTARGASALVRIDADQAKLDEMLRGVQQQPTARVGINGDAFDEGVRAGRSIELGSGPALGAPTEGKIDDGNS